MVVGIGERRRQIESNSYLLGFRDTVMLCLGFLPVELTRSRMYSVYRRIHAQLTRIGLIGFDLPQQTIFSDMLRKLHRQEIIEESYVDQNYTVRLTTQGEAAFEVIMANLQIHPDFNRIMNVYDFYSDSAVWEIVKQND